MQWCRCNQYSKCRASEADKDTGPASSRQLSSLLTCNRYSAGSTRASLRVFHPATIALPISAHSSDNRPCVSCRAVDLLVWMQQSPRNTRKMMSMTMQPGASLGGPAASRPTSRAVCDAALCRPWSLSDREDTGTWQGRGYALFGLACMSVVYAPASPHFSSCILVI